MYTNLTPFNVSASVADPLTRNKLLFHFSSQGLCSLSKYTHSSLCASSFAVSQVREVVPRMTIRLPEI